MSIWPVPSFSILFQTASTSRSSSSSWALLSNLPGTGSFAFSSLRTRSRSLWMSISLRASSKASISSYTVTGLSGRLW